MHLVEIRQELWAVRELHRQLLLHLDFTSLLFSVEKYVGLGGLLIGCFLSPAPHSNDRTDWRRQANSILVTAQFSFLAEEPHINPESQLPPSQSLSLSPHTALSI